jgi:two-component system, cell cycle response regulator CpdR
MWFARLEVPMQKCIEIFQRFARLGLKRNPIRIDLNGLPLNNRHLAPRTFLVRSMKVKRLLIADDDSALRGLLSKLCHDFAEVVCSAKHGAEALTIIRAWQAAPDVLVTDLDMPVMSGEELLKSLAVACTIPPVVIVMSSWARDPELMQRLSKLIPHIHFLEKPFAVQSLFEAMGGKRLNAIIEGR